MSAVNNLSNEEYHARDGVSASQLKLLEESPIHFENRHLFKWSSASFSLGSLVHKMILEPETLHDEYIKEDFEGADLNKNSKTYKDAKALFMDEAEGKEVVAADVWAVAERMAENVLAIAGGLLQNGVAEQSFFIDDDLYGITRKCRPDYYREDIGVVIDVKTTRDSKDYEFSKSIHEYGYHRQAAWYLDTLTLAGLKAERFLFIMVDSANGHMVRVREIDMESIIKGREEIMDMLDGYREYKESGEDGVPVKAISLPEWAKI